MAETRGPLLEVRDLRVEFSQGRGRSVTAISGVSFTLGRGEILGIVGESGCGKSVTANAIMGLLPKGTGRITQGEILLNGRDLVPLTDRELDRIRGREAGMIFQEPMTSLNPVYRIEKQLSEMLLAHERLSREACHTRCLEMLREVGIPEPEQRLKEFPHQLSGGMRQRVMIAMVLLARPDLILADEPTTALDVTIQAQIMDLMGSLRDRLGTSIILITHDLGVVANTADRVLVMYGGNVVEAAPVEDLFRHPAHPYTRGLLASIPRLDEDVEELETILGTVPPLHEMPAGCHFSTRCGLCAGVCREAPPELREIAPGHLAACHRMGEG